MGKKKVVRIRKAVIPEGGMPIKDPIRFLQDTGLLWHFNAKTLAPLGLGMEVDPSEECGWKLMDYRSNPSQVFSTEDFKEGQAKLDRYMDAYGKKTMAVRRELLGWITQKEDSA